jgi:CubicO group peptidase (beta-lactamase class C family)
MAPSAGMADPVTGPTGFEKAAKTAFEASGVPGLSVAIASHADVLEQLVLGRRRVDRAGAVAPGDAFHLASVTKPLTATMIATLVDGGLLRWDETPAQVWPAWTERMDKRLSAVTLRMLLSHRSGIAAFTDLAEIDAAPRFKGDGRAQRAAFAQWLLARPPAYKAGSPHYSNAGIALAATMAETVAGRSWESLMTERLFTPLGMTSCGFGWPLARDREWPWGHRYQDLGFVPRDPADGYAIRPFLAPAEDVSCSAADLARFGRAWLNALAGDTSLISADSRRTLVAARDGAALGWFVGDGVLYHEGGAGTFHGGLFVIPSHDLVVVALANAGRSRPGTSVVNPVLAAALAAWGPAPTSGNSPQKP